MDATYNTNKHNLALAILSGVSNEGKNIILAVAFLSWETAENYSWLLRTLTDMNNRIEPRTIMTDFDSSMCQAIEQTYSKTTHMLCQWHMMQNFKKHFMHLSKRKTGHSKLLYNHIMDTIFCDSPKRFQELQDVIFQNSDLEPQRLHYLRQLFLIKEKWSTAY
jgi:hypothetical protein